MPTASGPIASTRVVSSVMKTMFGRMPVFAELVDVVSCAFPQARRRNVAHVARRLVRIRHVFYHSSSLQGRRQRAEGRSDLREQVRSCISRSYLSTTSYHDLGDIEVAVTASHRLWQQNCARGRHANIAPDLYVRGVSRILRGICAEVRTPNPLPPGEGRVKGRTWL